MTGVKVPHPLDIVLVPAARLMAEGGLQGEYGVELGRSFAARFNKHRGLILPFLTQEVVRASGRRRTVRLPLDGLPRFSTPLLTVCVIDRTTARMRLLVNGRVDYRRPGDFEYSIFEGPHGNGIAILRRVTG